MLDREALKKFDLAAGDIALLETLEAPMQWYAELCGADMFIGCFTPDGSASVVVAEARPTTTLSNYRSSVLGQTALPENEPALFAARRLGMPVWDTMAITQERKTVRQAACPIKGGDGRVIGTLICETDISDDVRRSEKYEAMARLMESFGAARGCAASDHRFEARELHHRVKNELQTVASILNIEARRSSSPEIKSVFKKNVARILNFAEIYDILVRSESDDEVSLLEVMRNICARAEMDAADMARGVSITVSGDDVKLTPERASLVGIAVSELVSNAARHAFKSRGGGHIGVVITCGNSRSAIMIEDDGSGFDIDSERSGFGLELVRMTVEERLGGTLHAESGAGGSKFTFDF